MSQFVHDERRILSESSAHPGCRCLARCVRSQPYRDEVVDGCVDSCESGEMPVVDKRLFVVFWGRRSGEGMLYGDSNGKFVIFRHAHPL